MESSSALQTPNLLGCDATMFQAWIATLRDETMTDINHGTTWYIATAAPITSLDFTDEANLPNFHWKNYYAVRRDHVETRTVEQIVIDVKTLADAFEQSYTP